MIVYAYTSLLTVYYCPERGSNQVQAYLTAQGNIAISWLTETELISALSKKVRASALTADDVRKIVELFQAHIDTGIYEMLSINASDYWQAIRFTGRFDTNLRTLDALHVAVALRESNIPATADIKLAEAAERLGGNVFLLITPWLAASSRSIFFFAVMRGASRYCARATNLRLIKQLHS